MGITEAAQSLRPAVGGPQTRAFDQQHCLDLVGIAAEDYDPHSREIALQGHEAMR